MIFIAEPNDQNEATEALKARIVELEARIIELEAQHKTLEEEMQFLKDDLEDADISVEKLEMTIQQLQNSDGVFLNQDQVVSRIRSILDECVHNVTITCPTIMGVSKLDLFDLKSNINIQAAFHIDLSNGESLKILEELESFDNITLREYPEQDRWSVFKDGEILFVAIVGKQPDHLMSFRTDDTKHLSVYKSLVMEPWLLGKKIQ